MSNNNYLDKVYTVGASDPGQRDNSSGDESDHDQRRGGQEFYDAISDPAALRNARLDPISEQVKSADLTQTPIPPLFADRATSVTTGTVPYKWPRTSNKSNHIDAITASAAKRSCNSGG